MKAVRLTCIAVACLGGFVSCSTVVSPATLKKKYDVAADKTRMATVMARLTYQGEAASHHLIRLDRGGVADFSTLYRLRTSEVRSEIVLEFTKDASQWVGCWLSQEGDGEFVIRPVSRSQPLLWEGVR